MIYGINSSLNTSHTHPSKLTEKMKTSCILICLCSKQFPHLSIFHLAFFWHQHFPYYLKGRLQTGGENINLTHTHKKRNPTAARFYSGTFALQDHSLPFVICFLSFDRTFNNFLILNNQNKQNNYRFPWKQKKAFHSLVLQC